MNKLSLFKFDHIVTGKESVSSDQLFRMLKQCENTKMEKAVFDLYLQCDSCKNYYQGEATLDDEGKEIIIHPQLKIVNWGQHLCKSCDKCIKIEVYEELITKLKE